MFGLCLGHFFRWNQQMASQVTPGYNPEVSLLQGGNAPIVPVQGGGGMEAGAGLPPDYNPSNSLLNVGASAPIVPVKGGGQEGGDDKTAYQDYVIERYEPALTSVSIPTLTPEARKGVLIPLVQLYKKATEPKLLELKSFLRDPVPFVPEDEDAPLYKICPTPGGVRTVRPKFFQRVRRRIVTITYDDPKICILPNINGEVSKFLQYMKLFSDAEGVLKPGYFVLLTGSFFSENKDENAMLYIEFLKAKQKNPETLYQLIELTPDFISASCELYKVIYSESYLESPEGKNRPLVPFLEPNIVIFRNQHLLFKTSELPIQRDDPAVKVSEMLTKTPPEKYASIVITPKLGAVDEVPGNAGDAPAEKKYFRFDLTPGLYKFLKFPSTSSIVCPKGQTCQNFKGGYTLDETLTDDLKLPESGIYILYKNTDKMPLLKEEGATLSEEERGALAAKPPPKEEKPAAAPRVEKPAKPEERAFEELAEPNGALSLKERFEASPLAVKGSEERTIEVNSFKFFIRYPLEEEVNKDWKEGKFTQSEVDFFNLLELTPTLVNKAFGKKDANAKLAEFLQSIVLSNCFEDVSLLSKNECSNTHAFVKQIYYTKLRFLLESMYDELGVLKPLSFLDLIALLKRLLKDKPLQAIRISQKNFRGNLFNPMHKIVFDPATALFSIDFAEIPQDVIDAIKFSRISNTDYDAVIRYMFSIAEAEERALGEDKNNNVGEDNNDEDNAPPPPGFLSRARALLRRSPSSPDAKEDDVDEAAEETVPKGPSVLNRLRSRLTRPKSEFGQAVTGLKKTIAAPLRFRSMFSRSPKAATPVPENYVVEDLRSFSPPKDFFNVIKTDGDGLCFYRAVLKGLQTSPSSNSKFPPRYNPNKAETLAFIKQVRAELEAKRGTLEIGGVPVEEFFNNMYAPKEGEEKVLEPHADGSPFTETEMQGRIRHKGQLVKMTFQDYLDLMNSANPDDIPYADSDAGIGQIVAALKDIIIVLYIKLADGSYNSIRKTFYMSPSYTETTTFPLTKVVFLENTGGNHFNLLKIKPGNAWPHVMVTVVSGGGEEIFDLGEAQTGGGEEVFDLGEPIKRRFTRRNKKRNQK